MDESELIKAAEPIILKAFNSQGHAKVFRTNCCNKLFLGVGAPEKCRTCFGKPLATEVLTETETK